MTLFLVSASMCGATVNAIEVVSRSSLHTKPKLSDHAGRKGSTVWAYGKEDVMISFPLP